MEGGCLTGWSAFEKEILGKGLQMYGWDPCKIARLLSSRTCLEVGGALPPVVPDEEVEPDNADAPSRVHSRRKKSNYQRKRALGKVSRKALGKVSRKHIYLSFGGQRVSSHGLILEDNGPKKINQATYACT